MLAAAQLLPDTPRIHHISGIESAARQVVCSAVLARAGLMRGARVGQHHAVFAVLVLEEIEDSELLHQPGNEVEVGLPVLNAILKLVIGAGKAGLVLNSAIVKNGL